ncbi:MAG: radical SAM protein [Candidatus Fermentibacteraceae bacterium]
MTEITLAPRSVTVLITGRCNLSCTHCGVRPPGDDLPLTTWEKILDRLLDAKVLELVVSGGEPLARRDFGDFTGMISEKPFRFSLNTNATLLTTETASLLKRAGPRLALIMAGLDGPDAATHDALRGKGVFSRAVEGIRRAVGAGLPVIINCTVTRLNHDRVIETADFALNDLGVGGAKFTPVLAAQCAVPDGFHGDLAGLVKAGLDLLELGDPRVFGPLPDMARMAGDTLNRRARQTGGRAFSCGGCTGKIAVAADGSVIPCDYLDGFVLGRLPGQTLNEVMASEKTAEFLSILAARRAENPDCELCEYLDVCPGGCPVNPLLRGETTGRDELSCLRNLVEALRSLH